jgi:pSer/pThr/pTyr-binding forkhead associated (FHA) protein
MWKLVIEDDEARRTAVPLSRDEYSIGRKEGNSIRLTERNVSREHVRLRKHQNGGGPTYMIEDLKSYNGVYVNGVRVAANQELSNGDLIQIGDYRIIFQEDAPEQPHPPSDEVSTVPGPGHVAHATQPIEYDIKVTQPGTVQSPFRASLLMDRPARLVMLVGPTPGVEYPMTTERMTIGRAEDATISINHNSVSRLHCEIHALGEGRYEIIDKGSSNGIRVNAAELKRGIVEAGDLIELGDVRLKFIAAGQVFVPGPNESQQLTAIADRIAPDPSVKRSKSGVLPFALLGAVVALIVLGGGLILMKKKAQQKEDEQQPAVGTQTPIDMEQQILKDAKALCTKDDCERAHIKATTGLRENSPLRDSQDFKDLEASWAEWMFAKADAEPDFGKKKDIYQRVSQTITVDKDHRKTATDKLEALDRSMGASTDPTPTTDSTAVAINDPAPPQTSAPTNNASATGTRPPPRTTSQPTSVAHPPPTQPTQPPPPQPTTAPTPKPPAGGSAVDRARALLLDHPDQAKLILYDRLTKGGTQEELNVLKQACKATSDTPCVNECKRRLGQ